MPDERLLLLRIAHRDHREEKIMAGISQADKNAIAAKWAQNLEASAPPARGAAAPALAAGIDPHALFCSDWPKVKQFLQTIQPLLPQPGPILVGVIIALGDAAFGTVCPVP
jgi:hypothetical protein